MVRAVDKADADIGSHLPFIYADKFTRLFYLLIQLVRAVIIMVGGVGDD